MMRQNKDGLYVCAMCGKEYVKSACNKWKVGFAGQANHCCSYTCYLKGKRQKEQENESSYIKLKHENKLNKGAVQ